MKSTSNPLNRSSKDTKINQYFDPRIGNGFNELDLATKLSECLIDLSDNYPKPDTVLSICQGKTEIPLCTRQSISGIIGKAKGGKTALTTLFASAVLTKNVGDENVSLKSNASGTILFFDTEQGKYYASLTASRIKGISPNAYIDRLRYYDLREHNPERRLQLIRAALQKEKEIAMVIIDGGRDIVFDINSPKEAIDIITDLMALSVKYNTHICIVLHQNKGDSNARGHFGSELINKSETVLSVNKLGANQAISEVKPEFTRGCMFSGFVIQRDNNGTPYMAELSIAKDRSNNKRGISANDIDESIHYNIIEEAFKEQPEKEYGETYKAIGRLFAESDTKIGTNKSKEFLKYYQERGWIVAIKPSRGNTLYKSGLSKESD